MRISTFYDESNNIFQRDLQRARGKTCPVSCPNDFSFYNEIVEDASCNHRLRYHARSVLRAISLQERDYKVLAGGYQDTHNDIEKLGCQSYFDTYCVLLTLDNRLDLVFQRCCGADPKNIRKLPNYDLLSFNLMNVNFKIEDNITFQTFKGYDTNLDKYIASCHSTKILDSSLTNLDIISRFYRGILGTAATLLETVAMGIYKELNLSLRSQGFSNFVFGALAKKKPIPDKVTIYNENSEVDLPLYVLKKKEYFDLLEKGVIL